MKNLAERSLAFAPKSHWRRKSKLFIKNCLEHTAVLNIIMRVWGLTVNKWIALRYRTRLAKNYLSAYYCHSIDPDKTFNIPPESIVYSGLIEFNIQQFKGRVISGDWDDLTLKFCDIDLFCALKHVIHNNGDWQDTQFYQRIVAKLSNGDVYWNCSDKQAFLKRCKNIELLFYEIKVNGYKTQKEILNNISNDIRKLDDEITLSVGRYGDLLFSNSAHRLTIAKLIPLESVPAKISARHPEWILFVRQLSSYLNNIEHKPELALTHPDLIKLGSSEPQNAIYDLVRGSSNIQNGILLDLGARLGFYSSLFQADGFNCYALENNPTEFDLLCKINHAEKYNLNILKHNKLEFDWLIEKQFDITLALDFLPYFLKTKELFNTLKCLLRQLNTRELYFIAYKFDDYNKFKFYKVYSPQQFSDMILFYSNLTKSEVIGSTKLGQPIFRIYN